MLAPALEVSEASHTSTPLPFVILIAIGSADAVVKSMPPVLFCSGICVLFSVTCLPTTLVAWMTSVPWVA